MHRVRMSRSTYGHTRKLGARRPIAIQVQSLPDRARLARGPGEMSATGGALPAMTGDFGYGAGAV